jgi:hypothetical protein
LRPSPINAYALINARIMPMERGALYADPLLEALQANGYGVASGGGTLSAKNHEIINCVIDVDLFNLEQGSPSCANS